MILLHLKAKELKSGDVNPKNYPFRDELIDLLMDKFPEQEIKEIDKLIPLKESIELVKKSSIIICIDSYLNHLCWYLGKKAIVLFGQSDPLLFGHPENVNLLKDRSYLRKWQYDVWEWSSFNSTVCNNDAFLLPEKVLEYIK